MTVLADFNIIIPEEFRSVGAPSGQQSPLGTRFNAGGRLGEGSGETGALAAFIMFSVLNLQIPLDVFVNGEGPNLAPYTPTRLRVGTRRCSV